MNEALASARLSAWPYWMTITFVPLVVLAVTQGGWYILLIPFYGWVLMPLLDMVLGKNLRNPDPETPDKELFWFRLLTWVWFPIQFCLVFGTLYYLSHFGSYRWYEVLGIMFGIGVTTGIVGIVYAHELMHKASRFERHLGDLLLALVLYGHFRTEHLLVHHPWVGTPRDTVTARYNEGFHRAFFRILWQGPGSAWRAEKAMLSRRNRSPFHRSNPIWKYLMLAMIMLAVAFAIGGWFAVGLFIFQAFIAIWQLELTNYVEHYGLTRKYLGDGKYEPVALHHSWDSAHHVSGLLLINLQRHADHHLNPMRRFPLLQIYDQSKVPQLPTGYPPMTFMAMIPPVWRRVFNPKVRAWRRQFYPEIEDWGPYKTWSYPMPKGVD
ncbi:MAG: alkane 1-monooxygenase [Marinosulfonomonas sp.]|nr:MAG: alkane 1-monooxygenase [Marinosulfonomonas sp.]